MKRLAILVFVTTLALGIAVGPALSAPSAGPAGSKKEKVDSSQPKKAPAKSVTSKKAPAKPQLEAKKQPAAKPKPGSAAKAADTTKTADVAKTPETKPATYKIKKRVFKVEVSLEGTFEARSMADVVLRPDEWTDFPVLRAVDHGTPVKQGDLLVSLDTEKIDRTIADLERDISLARLGLRDTEAQLQATRNGAPLDLAAATRTKRMIDEDLDRFLRVDRPMYERTANFMLKMTEDQLAYEKEELRQLEKMYKADDLTEETEEIILRRARDSVARAQFMADRAKIEHESTLKMSIPRAEGALKLAAKRQAVELWKTEVSLPAAQRKLELSLEKMKVDLERSQERLKRLVSDRKQMNVKAPISGIVYYGKIVRGKWTGADMAADKLRRGGRLTGDDIFMTIADPRPLGIRAWAGEKQLQNLTAGLKGVARPTAFPDLKLTAIVDRVAGVPSGTKDFDTTVTVALGDEARAVMPGMGCEMRFVPYLKTDALAIPLAALGTDEIDSQKQLVALPGKDGQPVRRPVVVGKRTDKLVEILKGVSPGEEILAEFPKEKE